MLKTLTIMTMILSTLALLALACVEIVKLHEIIDFQRDVIRIHEEFICAILDQMAEVRGQRERVVDATVTAYSPHKKQTDGDPLVAASMRRVREGTVAVSRDLFWAGWVFGRRVYIEGHGVFEVNDLMNARYDGRIDVFRWSKDAARAFGAQQCRAALLD